MTYDVPQERVNEVVVANLTNKRFIEELDNVAVTADGEDEYNNVVCLGMCIAAIAVAVISLTATIWNNSVKNQRAIDAAIYEGRRDMYLSKEQQAKILHAQSGKLLKELELVQLEYLTQEELLRDQQETEKKQNIAIIVGGGMIVVAIAIYILKK